MHEVRGGGVIPVRVWCGLCMRGLWISRGVSCEGLYVVAALPALARGGGGVWGGRGVVGVNVFYIVLR